MTDNEIIEGLKCCHGECEYSPGCDSCPNKNTCGEVDVVESVLDLLGRQKAEIERLEKELTEYKLRLKMSKCAVDEIKSEAIKEFARKLENALDNRVGDYIPILGDRDNVYCAVSDIYDVIDNLVKQMTEAEK